MMNWRSIESGPLRGAENMAHDQALLEGVQAGGPPVLRFYRWAPACLSLGRNQVVARREEVAAAVAARGFDLVRRATGGAAVLHDRELTYSVAVPVGVLGAPRETYLAINRALVEGLRGVGVAAEVAGAVHAGETGDHGHRATARSGATPPVAWENPCFQAPAPGEVVVRGLKLVGSAQRREGRTLLQHGSLLLAGDQGVVAECLAGVAGLAGAAAGLPGDAVGASDMGDTGSATPPANARHEIVAAPSGFTTLAALLDPLPSWVELIAALSAGFAERLGVTLQPSDLTAAERARIGPLTTHFQSPAWTWRR
jgi:lipoate-protein ligase A